MDNGFAINLDEIFNTDPVDYVDYDKVTREALPRDFADLFEQLTDEYKENANAEFEPEPGDPEELEFEVDYGVTQVDGKNVYCLSIHEPSPFNPSGFEIYFFEDGDLYGWCES